MTEATDVSHGARPDKDHRPKVEIGWILEDDLPSTQRDAAKTAIAAMESSLTRCMPQFDWVVDTLERPIEATANRIEPVQLLDVAEIDRDTRGWDFAFVATARQLRGRERTHVLGTTSGIFSTATLSTAFLVDHDQETEQTAHRFHALAMHLFGRLNGLAPDRSDTWTRRLDVAEDLDEVQGFDKDALAHLAEQMEDVADLRVEETHATHRGKLDFYIRSLWSNRNALPRVILKMRPWSFPLRLRRLTTAAGSALAVLVMTAESWEVAANLTFGAITAISLVSLAAMSAYLLQAQHLLASRRGPLREQRVVSNTGTVIAVVIGMITTYLGVFIAAWLMANVLFGDSLLERWVGAPAGDLSVVRTQMAALAAALSVVIGALGASFEPYGYFRHVTQIDDEV